MDRNDSHQPDAGEPSAKLTPMTGQDSQTVQTQPEIAYPRVYPMDELTPMPPSEWMKKVPGDLEELQRLVSNISGTAGNIGEQVRRLKHVNVGTFWNGDAAKAFTDYKEQLPPPLELAQKRYHGTAHALRTYTTALHDIKQTARRAVQEATEAKHFIETHGHHVSEWRMYVDGHPLPYPIPIGRQHFPDMVDPDMIMPFHKNDSFGQEQHPHTDKLQPMHRNDVEQVPGRSGVISHQTHIAPFPQLPAGLMAEFERFGASVKLMESAIDRYDVVAKRCAAGIRNAIDDDLKNTAGYGKDLSTLKHKLNANLAAIAPQLQGQLGRITGVAGLLGWLPMIAAFAGKDPQAKKTLKELSKDAEQWKSANGDGKQIVDGFLKLLTANTDHASGHGSVGHGGAGGGGHTGGTYHPPHTPDVWQIATDHPAEVGATAVEGTIRPDTPAQVSEATITPDTPAGIALPGGNSNFSFDAGGATVNVSITAPESMSQVATHTVPVPAGV